MTTEAREVFTEDEILFIGACINKYMSSHPELWEPAYQDGEHVGYFATDERIDIKNAGGAEIAHHWMEPKDLRCIKNVGPSGG